MSNENGGGTPHLRIVLGVVFILSAAMMFFVSLENDNSFLFFSGSFFLVLGIAVLSPRFGQLLLNVLWSFARGTKKRVVAADRQTRCEVETPEGLCANTAVWATVLVMDRLRGQAMSPLAGKVLRCCNEHHPVPWDESPAEDFQELGKKALETKRMLNRYNVRPERIIMIQRLY